jgi:ribosomal protein S18 acetylase RimI-like enzyme
MSELRFSFAGHGAAGEISEIQALVHAAYRGESSRAGWTTEADLLGGQRIDDQMLADLLQEPGAHILLARQGQELMACCELREPDGTGTAYLGMFAVRPRLQDLGLGRTLLAEAERIAREDWQATAMRMTVIDERTELLAWYARRGYEPTGAYQAFPHGDPRFGIPVRKLRLAVLVKALE